MAELTGPYAADYYDRLGQPRTASSQEIKRGYQALLRLFPPERAPEEFKRIREAYETLIDAVSRRGYDDQPNAQITEWLAAADAAMEAKEYPRAERIFKQVLLSEPTLDFARNMLGLCFMYEEKYTDAVAQFQRLISAADAPAVWLVNAGHAYRKAKRFPEAEATMRRAANRGGAGAVDAFLGLVDVAVDQERYDQALRTIEEGIAADGRLDFDDLLLVLRAIDVEIYRRHLDGVRGQVARACRIACDDNQRQYVAMRLGLKSQALVAATDFEYAICLATAAKEVEPGDPEYTALLDLASSLDRNQIDTALRLVRTHPSFGESGWVKGLRPIVERYCSEKAALGGLEPIRTTPSMWTVNGCGMKLYGHTDDDARTGFGHFGSSLRVCVGAGL